MAQYRSIADEVMPAVQAVVDRQAFIMGSEVSVLEERIAELSRAAHGVACASGTDALLLPLKALELAPGDEVICPSFTFFATAGAVHNAGGKPVFVDIDPVTFNLDPQLVEAAITPRTRAIIAVTDPGLEGVSGRYYDQLREARAHRQAYDPDARARLRTLSERLTGLAERHGLALIEDAAQAIGARRKVGDGWVVAGSVGRVGTLSFFPSKNLGAWGDGGMILTSDDALAERLRKLRLHGGAKQYHHDEVGFNSRLDTLQAAVLLAKLPHLADWSEGRRRVAARYDALLADLPQVKTPQVDPANEPIFHQYTIRAERRDELHEFLRQEIGCAVYYPVGLHLQPCFAHLGMGAGSLPETERAMGEVLALPVFPELSAAQQDSVVDALRAFYSQS